MPKIPTYISQRSIPAGSPNVPISAEAATAVPRAISGLGQDINQLGGQIQDREIRFQNELIKRQAKIADDQAELKAINSLNDWNQILRQRKLQNTERQFGDAVGIGKESVEWYNKEVQNHTKDLSPLAKAKFDKMSTGEQKSFLDAAYTYESSQMKEWKKSTWGGTFERYKDEISTFPEDSEAFNNIMQESFAYIDKFLGGDSNLKAQVEDDYNKTRLKAIYQHATTGIIESKIWKAEFDKIKGSIGDKILVRDYEKLYKDNEKNLATKTNAVVSQSLAEQVISKTQNIDPNAPFDLQSAYNEVKATTDDPEIRKGALEILNKEQKIHNEAIKTRFDFNYSAISSALQNDPKMTVNDVKKMNEYTNIPETLRDDALAKVSAFIEHRNMVERTTKAAERSATAAEKSAENQRLRDINDRYDNEYNSIMGSTTRLENLALMSDDEFNTYEFYVGSKNKAKLLIERNKLREKEGYDDALLTRRRYTTEALKGLGDINDTTRALYTDAIRDYVGDETDARKIKEKVAEAVQNAVFNDNGFFGKATVTINKPNTPTSKNGPFIGYKKGTDIPVFDIGNRKLQLGND